MADERCKRCGNPTPSYEFDNDSTFWGWVTKEVKTTTEHQLRIQSHYWRREPRLGGTPHLKSDERWALCSDCWGLLIGRFFQGRDIPAMPGKEGR